MALNQIGSAAGEAADATRRRDTVVPRSAPPADSSESLLDAIRRSLRPADPVSQLLAVWRMVPPS